MEKAMKKRCGFLSRQAVVACGVLLLAAPGAFAQRAGDTVVSGGVALIMPDESLGTLHSVGPAAPAFNAATAGATASIANVTTASFSVLHMFTDNIAGEFTFGVPPKMKVDVQLTSGSHPDAASARVLIPALLGKYVFRSPAEPLRPFVGLGVTRVSFTSVSANKSDPLINQLAGTSSSLSAKWAPVFAAGAIYNFNDRWSITGSLSYVPVKTEATFVGSGTTTKGTLRLNPTDLIVRVGYRF
jgi:outer membrane protein